jgi:hypothetical protein
MSLISQLWRILLLQFLKGRPFHDTCHPRLKVNSIHLGLIEVTAYGSIFSFLRDRYPDIFLLPESELGLSSKICAYSALECLKSCLLTQKARSKS